MKHKYDIRISADSDEGAIELLSCVLNSIKNKEMEDHKIHKIIMTQYEEDNL